MEKASKVMYTIANIFVWINIVVAIFGIVLCGLNIAHVTIPDADISQFTLPYLVYLIIVIIASIVTIALARMAKKKGTSKGWDILFIVFGVLSSNIFYLLGGLFGVIAKK